MASFSKGLMAKTTAMTAAMAFAIAVLVADSRFLPYASTATAEDTTQATTEPVDIDAGLKQLTDCFGNIDMYRWEKMTGSNINKYKDGSKQLSALIFWDDGRYIMNPAGAKDIYLANLHSPISGARYVGDAGLTSYPVDLNSAREDQSAFVKCYPTANYPTINTNQDVFFTPENCNCVYLLFGHSEKATHYDSTDSCYRLDLSDGKGNYSGLNVNMSVYNFDKGSAWKNSTSALRVFKDTDPEDALHFKSDGDGFIVFNDNADFPDSHLQMAKKDGLGWMYAESKNTAWTQGVYNDYTGDQKCKIYIGEKMRFTALKGDTEIGAGQILSISSRAYADANNSTTSTSGVMLSGGDTITVKKGGILSIEGTLINNGTIINDGGTIIIKNGGTICPFLMSGSYTTAGCNTIKCVSGDIIIQEGGALYAGLNDPNGAIVPFYLDDNSTLINQGLLVYGTMRVGASARVQLYEKSMTYGGYFLMSDYGHAANNGAYFMDSMFEDEKAAENGISTMKSLGYTVIGTRKKTRYYLNGSSREMICVTFYVGKYLAQEDILTKQNKDFLSKAYSATSGQGNRIIKPAQVSATLPGIGMVVKSGLSDRERPHFEKTDDAYINDVGMALSGDYTTEGTNAASLNDPNHTRLYKNDWSVLGI